MTGAPHPPTGIDQRSAGKYSSVVPDDGLTAAELRTLMPLYGVASLADLLPSVTAALGVSGAGDVLDLRTRLAGVRRVAVLLVDGLGWHQLPLVAEVAPAVAELVGHGRRLTAGFPTTTPVSLVTLGTGAEPGRHGVLGFTVRRPDNGQVLNHIRWGDDPDPHRWQPLPTRFASAAAAGVDVTVVTRAAYAGTGLSVAAHRGARLCGVTNRDETAAGMLAALRDRADPALVYGYHPELDKAGHEHGVNSPRWRTAAAEVGDLVSRLVDGLPPATALLVTADHGQLNVPADARFDIADRPEMRAGVDTIAGEPRVRYLHTAPGATASVVATWRSVLGSAAWVGTRAEAVAAGWFGPMSAPHVERVGDVVVICRDRYVVLDTRDEPAGVARLIGYHGAATAAEMAVPLLIAVHP